MSVHFQEKAIGKGFLQQVNRAKTRQAEMKQQSGTIELIVRVEVSATFNHQAENIVIGAMNRHPHIRSASILPAVIDRAKYDDLLSYTNTMEIPSPSAERNGEGFREGSQPEKTKFVTRVQMAEMHNVTPSTIKRWLERKPVPGETFNGGQYQIPESAAINYIPIKHKVGRKPKEK